MDEESDLECSKLVEKEALPPLRECDYRLNGDLIAVLALERETTVPRRCVKVRGLLIL